MRMRSLGTCTCCGLVALLLGGTARAQEEFASEKMQNWHQWRGPLATGAAPQADPPVRWSEENNVQWKVPIDGAGSSTPIIWGDKVFLLTSINTGKVDPDLPKPEDQPDRPFGIKFPNTFYQFVVLCLDRGSGEELWRRVAIEMIPKQGHHGDNNFASSSPTTDGERLYVWFGSAGWMFCYDLEGELLWKRELGQVEMRRSFGEGSSPVVHGDRVVLSRDNEGQSYIVALDAATGEVTWKVDRDEQSAWATPLVIQHNGRAQVVTNASNRVRSYDLRDGSLIWECGGQVGNVTPSPVTEGSLVFCMSGYRGSALYALPLDSQGDITGSERIAWSRDRGTPYVPSPLLYDGILYFNQSNNAIMSSIDADTGETVIEPTRMPAIRRIYASPVGAAGRIYFFGRDGAALVIEHGRQFKVVAENRLFEGTDASPALVGKQLFVRGVKHLYCLAEE